MIKKIVNRFRKNYRNYNNKEITIEELKILQEKGAIVIDVRSKQEYNEGHLKNAILLSDFDINKKTISNIIDNKDKVIILYCSTGSRSKKIQKRLISFGYKNVYNLYGGLEEY